MSDAREIIASGLATLSSRLSRGVASDPLFVAAGVSAPLASVLEDVIRLAKRSTDIVLASSKYRRPLAQGLAAACAVLCEATSQALRHISAAIPDDRYPDRLQLSNAATVFHGVASQFHGPLRALVTYSDLDVVYGATMASNALGGRPISPIKNDNAFEEIFGAVEKSPIFINTDASHAARALVRSDPILAPLHVDAVASYLAAIANGTRIDP